MSAALLIVQAAAGVVAIGAAILTVLWKAEGR
jgi:hypothetical protein